MKSLFNKLHVKINSGLLIILVISFIGLGYFNIKHQQSNFKSNLEKQGSRQASLVAAACISPIKRDSLALLEEIAKQANFSPQVAFCAISLNDGRRFQDASWDEQVPGEEEQVSQFEAKDMFVLSKKIVSEGQELGTVEIGMHMGEINKQIQGITYRLSASFFVVLIFVTLAMYLFINRFLISPVTNLSRVTKSLSAGDFVTTNLDRRNDEIGVLARGFNEMSNSLAKSYKELESKVEERTKDLQVSNAQLKEEVVERQDAQNRLKKTLEELEAIFENSFVGIAVFIGEKQISRSNYRFAELFGYNLQEISSLKPYDLHVSEEDYQTFYNQYIHKLNRNEIFKTEYQFKQKDGSLIWCEASAKTIDPSAHEQGVIWVFDDITERKKSSEALHRYAQDLQTAKRAADEATRSKSEFLARMSHEIRTPMNAIMAMAEMLEETKLSTEQQDYVQTFSSAGELLLGIINDVLDFSKIEAGQLVLEATSLNLLEIIEDVGRIMSYKAHEKGLELVAHLGTEVPGSNFIGDPTRLRQILVNLLSNAVKFTQSGEILLLVNAPYGQKDGTCELVFEVQDSGIGISQEKIDSIFDSFTQVDTSTTRKFGGTGLGLSICKKLIEMMGGSISVESQENMGTKFTFSIPFAVDAQSAEQEEKFDNLQGKKVLLLDDNLSSSAACKELLQYWGLQVRQVRSKMLTQAGLEGIEDEVDFDFVLLDGSICRQEWIEGINRTLSGQSLKIPFIGMFKTTKASRARNQVAQDIISCFVFKPIRREELSNALVSALQTPLDRAEQEQARKTESDLQKEEKKIISSESLPALNLLLVDDVEANRKVVELFLKDTSIQIQTAEDGQQAVDLFENNEYDLVLMDMEMPVMDGHEATERIRKWEKENKSCHIPVIALTAHAFAEYKQKTFDAGCTDFLKKPLTKDRLYQAIKDYAGHREEIVVIKQPSKMDDQAAGQDEYKDDELRDELSISHIKVDPELEELMPLFIKSLNDFMDKIETGLQENDFKSLRRHGHSMKGLGSTYGVNYVSLVGKKIEKASAERKADSVKVFLDALSHYLNTGEEKELDSEELLGTESRDEEEVFEHEPQINADGKYILRVSMEMQELLPFLLEDLHSDYELMRNALKEGDYSTIRRLGHSHRAFGSSYDLYYISELGVQLDRAARAMNAKKLCKLLDRLGDYLQNLEIEYDSEVSNQDDKTGAEDEQSSSFRDTKYKQVDFEMDPELYELLPLVLQTLDDRIIDMWQRLKEDDYQSLFALSEKLRELGSVYGLAYLTELSEQIGNACNEEQRDALYDLLNDFTDYLEDLRLIRDGDKDETAKH